MGGGYVYRGYLAPWQRRGIQRLLGGKNLPDALCRGSKNAVRRPGWFSPVPLFHNSPHVPPKTRS